MERQERPEMMDIGQSKKQEEGMVQDEYID